MNIIELEKDIFIYQFGPEEGSFLGQNIFMVQSGEECIIIETGFRRHFLKVLEDLKEKNIKISKVILTHFHPDHIGGIPRVGDAEIIGSIYAEKTLKLYVKDYLNYMPTSVVVDKKTLKFGRHEIQLELNSGHSIDGLLIALNDKYIFVGDEIISDNNGVASIPFCSEKDPVAHISAIKKILSKMKNKIILPTHGKPFTDRILLFKDLNDRLTYLNFINDNKNATYEDFLKETNIVFLGRDWHVLNQIK